MGQKPHEPSEESHKLVRTLSGLGVPQDDICVLVGCTKPTLHKHYRESLDKGLAEANSQIAQTLFKQAIGGNIAAAIFWAKARMGWREKQEFEITNITHVIRAPALTPTVKDWTEAHVPKAFTEH